MGNLWQKPLSALAAGYRADRHPICGSLLRGGQAALSADAGVPTGAGYVDECYLCDTVRKAILERYPAQLAPRQVYGR